MPAPKTEERKLAFEWMGMSTKERSDKGKPLFAGDMRKLLRVKASTWRGWEKQYESKKLRDVYMKSSPMVVGEKPKEPEVIKSQMTEVDAEKWAKDRAIEWLEATLASAKNGVAASQKLLAQIANMLIEKQEVTEKLDASFIAREILRIRRELESKGSPTLSGRPNLLPK